MTTETSFVRRRQRQHNYTNYICMIYATIRFIWAENAGLSLSQGLSDFGLSDISIYDSDDAADSSKP